MTDRQTLSVAEARRRDDYRQVLLWSDHSKVWADSVTWVGWLDQDFQRPMTMAPPPPPPAEPPYEMVPVLDLKGRRVWHPDGAAPGQVVTNVGVMVTFDTGLRLTFDPTMKIRCADEPAADIEARLQALSLIVGPSSFPGAR